MEAEVSASEEVLPDSDAVELFLVPSGFQSPFSSSVSRIPSAIACAIS